MVVSEAQKRANINYRKRIKGTPQGEIFNEKLREYAKRSFNKRYNNNPTFHDNHLAQANSRAYYLNDKDQFLRAIRRLYN